VEERRYKSVGCHLLYVFHGESGIEGAGGIGSQIFGRHGLIVELEMFDAYELVHLPYLLFKGHT
jgi:hypothetical protein